MDKSQSSSVVLNVIMGKGVNVTRLDEQFIISIGLLDFCRKRCEFFGNLIEGNALTENEKSQFKIRRKSLRTLIAFLKNLVEMRGNDNPDSPQDDEGKAEKSKEKDENDKKVGDESSSKNTEGKLETEGGDSIPVENKNGGNSQLHEKIAQ